MIRKLLPGLLVFVVACSAPVVVETTTAATNPPLTAVPTTEAPKIPVELQDCDAPPVTFKTLCETIELLGEWYVDRPVDMAHLAAIATQAAADYTTDVTEEPPRTFFCAVPDISFETLCEVLAGRVQHDQIPVAAAMEEVVLTMVDLGLDPFTWYVPPDLAAGFRSDGIVGGVGIVLDATDAAGSKCSRIAPACPLQISLVIEGNPGAEAGLMAGDVITAVDAESVDGKGFVNLATLIGGDETGKVALTVDRDGEVIEFSIERRELILPDIEVELPLPDVGYLRIPDFDSDIPRIVNAALASLVAASPRTIVIDLRDNPGGLVSAVIEVASEFIASGAILETDGPDEAFTYEALGDAQATSQRLVVLVNESTASAAEVLAGALRDRRNAVVIGQPTFGKNAVQIPFPLRNGGEFHVAIAYWTTPNGTSVVDGGLVPDRRVDFPEDPTIEELVTFALANS
jgi:carboxyl-terminal processing protease